MNTLKPRNIKVDKTVGELVIDWSDGLSCTYPLSNLREACPCVECRGGHENMGRANDPENLLVLTPKRSYKLEDAQLVGNYALQLFWDDGHHTGIFTWEYLHRLCPTQEQAPDSSQS